ncbi:DNA polymerase III subunit alpha, partial [bacterium]|nr:DNA polymerase III subunit alpha [bacterium]
SINKDLAEKIFSFIEPFAGYGFNRSHAACYALIGYQTAYLKAHWPVEFMAALLTCDQQNTDRVAIEIEECRNMGMEVLQPDINESVAFFTVTQFSNSGQAGIIRFGLNAIKNVGEHIVEAIIKERKENGRYKDIFDFLDRVIDRDLNKKSLESLIKSGCFDSMEDRGKLLNNLESLLNFNKEVSKIKESRQSSLFGEASGLDYPNQVGLKDFPPVKQQEKLSWEKELLGLYITEHPFNDFKRYLRDIAVPLNSLSAYKGDSYINIAGIITSIKKIMTRKNQSMIFAKIEDNYSNVEILVFPNLLKENPEIWEEGKVIICQGKVSDKDQDVKFLADSVGVILYEDMRGSVDNFKKNVQKKGAVNHEPPRDFFHSRALRPLKLILKDNPDKEKLEKLRDIFLKNKGESKVFLKIKHNGNSKYIESGFRVNNSEELTKEIKNYFKTFIEVA